MSIMNLWWVELAQHSKVLWADGLEDICSVDFMRLLFGRSLKKDAECYQYTGELKQARWR